MRSAARESPEPAERRADPRRETNASCGLMACDSPASAPTAPAAAIAEP